MADKSKNNKNTIIGTCCAIVVVVIIVVVAIVLATNGSNTINDAYFVSDNTKYVINMDNERGENSDSLTPLKTHVVYNYSGDKITSVKTYYEYPDEKSAQAALEYLKTAELEGYDDISQNGKYVVATTSESEYQNLTASDVKQQVELIEKYENSSTTTDDASNAE